MTVGEKIKEIRKSRGYTQKKLSELSKIPEISIRKYESGERNPKIEKLNKIAGALGVSKKVFVSDDYDQNIDSKRISNEDKIQAIADHYGFKYQSRQCIEELSELIQAICKYDRNEKDFFIPLSTNCKERTHIIEEIADCKIMIQQLEYLLSAECEVDEQIGFKLDRQMKRISRD